MSEMIESLLSDKDLQEIEKKGMDIATVKDQVRNFVTGFPYVKLDRPSTIGDGILQLSEKDLEHYTDYYEKESKSQKVTKFVPASGAASRMFKELFNFWEKKDPNHEMAKVLQKVDDFAFYDELKRIMAVDGKDAEDRSDDNLLVIADYILHKKGLNYGNLPKGLIRFHEYEHQFRTAFEEHLVEGAGYTKDKDNNVYLHFTVAPEHEKAIIHHLEDVRPYYEEHFGVNFHISYSTQKPSTDTIAVDMENKPFRDKEGEILFRPGGHGALLENLASIDTDVVFIKNIDNVVPDRIKGETYLYKKALGGLLLFIQSNIFKHLAKVKTNPNNGDTIDEALQFAREHLGISCPPEMAPLDFILTKFNRPIRVCGMVKNEGEPGGGPFWVEGDDGYISHQIVESSQVDLENSAQKAILEKSTHFNPVDLVCAIKDHEGENFDLHHYRDPKTGFISNKSKFGRELKAQELPGLWNGAMANWITLFVEVPIITFNPVKTVNDLLRENHQK